MGIKICPECGGKVADGRNTCMHCGHIFTVSKKKCPDCDESIDANLDLCPVCGHDFVKVESKSSATTAPKTVATATGTQAPTKVEINKKPGVVETPKPKVVSITCPNCASSDFIELGNEKYKCKFCDNTFAYNDGKPVIINNINYNSTTTNKRPYGVAGYQHKTTITEDDFNRKLLIELATKMDTPEDICYSIIETKLLPADIYAGKFHVTSIVNCSVGYDRFEKYYEDGKERTRTVTDWLPFSGSGHGDFISSAFSNGLLIPEYLDIIKNEPDENETEIPFVEITKDAYLAIQSDTEMLCEASIGIPGDHSRDKVFTSSSTPTRFEYHKGEAYFADFIYDGTKYHAYAIAHGLLVVNIPKYPIITNNLLLDAEHAIKKDNLIVKISLLATAVLLVASIAFLFLDFHWIWIGAVASTAIGLIFSIKRKKKFSKFLKTAAEDNTNKKKAALIERLKKENYKPLTKADEVDFKYWNDSKDFVNDNKKQIHPVNIFYIVASVIITIISLIMFSSFVKSKIDESNKNPQNILVDVVSSGYENDRLRLQYELKSTVYDLTGLELITEVSYVGEQIGELEVSFTGISLTVNTPKTFNVDFNINNSDIITSLLNHEISAFDLVHKLKSISIENDYVYYGDRNYREGEKFPLTSTNNKNKQSTSLAPKALGGDDNGNSNSGSGNNNSSEQKYNLYFVINGGDAINPIEDVTSIPASLPTPSRDGYDFDGWYTNSQLTNPAVSGSKITSNTYLYAKWTKKTPAVQYYDIYFVTNGGDAINPIEDVTSIPVSLPTPNRDGYDFAGWYTNSELTNLANPGSKITSDTYLYADWTKKTPGTLSYNVIYQDTGDTDIDDLEDVTYLPTTLPTPYKVGYRFDGWYTNSGLTDSAVAGSQITSDTYLYPKWIAKNAVISESFDDNPEIESGFDSETFDSQQFKIRSTSTDNYEINDNVLSLKNYKLAFDLGDKAINSGSVDICSMIYFSEMHPETFMKVFGKDSQDDLVSFEIRYKKLESNDLVFSFRYNDGNEAVDSEVIIDRKLYNLVVEIDLDNDTINLVSNGQLVIQCDFDFDNIVGFYYAAKDADNPLKTPKDIESVKIYTY